MTDNFSFSLTASQCTCTCNLFVILQEVSNLKHVIEVRENKLVDVSKENVDLQETCAVLGRFAWQSLLLFHKLLYMNEIKNIIRNRKLTSRCSTI